MHEHNIVIPGISLCQKWGKIRIFHSTIVALGEPKYIRFLFNPEKRGLVVQACARKEAECFRVPKYNPENWEFKISSVPMLRMGYGKDVSFYGDMSFRVQFGGI